MNKLFTRAVICASLLLGVFSHGVAGEPAYLQPPTSGSFYQVNEAFVISLPADLDEALLDALTLEVDSIDVTALTTRKGEKLIYQPLTQLSSGKHELRLMHYGSEGNVAEIAYWEVEVQQSAHFREASLRGELNLQASRRVAEGGDIDPHQSPATAVQGGGQYMGVLATKHWRHQANIALAYADDPAMSLTGRRADIPQFLVTSGSDRLSLNMGDHVVAAADLLNDGYQRRGISSSIAVPAVDSAISVFSTSANQRIGIDGGLGVSDSENRISGARWQYQPVKNQQAHIVLSSGFLSGKASEADFATLESDPFGPTITREGEAWNVALDALFFEKQLRMRWEQANSRYDFDGIESGYEAQQDEAWSALILFDFVSENPQKPVDWDIGMEKQKVGTWFKSIANPQLPADKEYQRTFVNGTRDKWSWNVSFAEENNNLDENRDYARTHTRQWVVGGAWQEYEKPDAGSLMDFLQPLVGQPAFNWYATGVDIEDRYTPGGFLANDLNTRSGNLNAVFNHQSWNWSLGYNQDSLQDHTGWQPQTRTRALLFNTGMQLGEHYYLALGWQLQQTDYVEQDVGTDRQLYSLEAQAEIIPGRLRGNISVGVNRNNALDDPYYALRDKSTYASTNLTWRLRKPKKNSAGLDLSLSVMRNEFSDFINTVNNTDGYQVFLKINTVLPTVLPGSAQ